MKILIAALVGLTVAAAFAVPVTEVKIVPCDGFGGEVGAVASRCQTKAGAEYDPVTVTRDVNALKASGEFDDIRADASEVEGGVEVVFSVQRKVRYLQPLTVEGNEFFTESKVSKEAALKDGFLYGEADFAEAAARVRLAYQKKGFADAKVTPRVNVVSANDAKVTFLVDEGLRGKVRSVIFKGADHAIETSVLERNLNPFCVPEEGSFDATELRDAIGDYPWWNPIGWFADDPVTADQRAQCCDKIAEIYRNYGYLDVTVSGPETVPAGDGEADLVFTVDEGPRYRVGTSNIRGLTRYAESDIRERGFLPETGAVAAQRDLDSAAERIKVLIGSGDVGLADTRVDVKCIPSANDASTVNLVFQVTEGVPVVINEVKVTGNNYTKDNVIRREILLGPGDRMLEDRAERSKHKLEELSYFSRVNYHLEPTNRGKDENGAEYRDLVFDVEEKNTGSFMVGLGASSVDSVYVMAEVNQNNFDLFAPSKYFRGGGQKGRASVSWGPRYQSIEVGVTEPYFLDRMLELSVDAYRRLRWYDQFDLIRSGASASLSYPVKFWNPRTLFDSEAESLVTFGRLGIGFSGEYIEMEDVQEGSYWTEERPNGYDYADDAGSVSFEDEENDYSGAFEPVFHLFWTRDARDRFQMPTRGYRTHLFADLGPGSKSSYWRLGLNHRHYWNTWRRYGHVLMAGVRAETIAAFSDDVPIYNRMFLGGPRSIRGIEYRNVAPMVTNGTNWEPWGGQTLFCANFEYTVPIVKLLRVAAFSDLGCVGCNDFDLDFSDTFAWTAGLGVRLDIPMFPVRLDFGFPIEKPDHAEEEVFSFTVGYDF